MYKLNSCRICGESLFEGPIFQLDKMPKAAQHLPTTPEKGVSLEVCQCSGCGVVQLNNAPVSYYKEVIRAVAFSQEMKEYRVSQFKDFISTHDLYNKRVLEVGCGKGEYLRLMKDAGADAHGIEFSSDSVRECRQQGLQACKQYIEKPDEKIFSAPFSAFFILNFFEHLPDPNATLKTLRSNLEEGGLGLVEVPNFDMMLENDLFSEFIGDHLFYFTKETLLSTLSRNGFEILNCEPIWHDYIISATVRKRTRLNLSGFYDQKNKIVSALHQYVDGYPRNSVSIYGAGHQALAIMAIADLGTKIKYVVDDATFKQGKYTPASNIPIVSSDWLSSEKPDAIIVMAASYSDEVASKLTQLDLDLDIAILREDELEIHNRNDRRVQYEQS